jgi:group I intron endonuclease
MDGEVVYIGQSKRSLDKRKWEHERNASRSRGYIIGAAIRKHGADKFEWKVHSIHFNQIDLDASEKHYIEKYKPRYNIFLGGETRGFYKGMGRTPWNKGKKGVQEAWNKGHIETRPDILEKLSQSAKNRKRTARPNDTKEAKDARSEGRREKYRKTNRSFICHQNRKTYLLVVDAAKDLNIPASGIYAVLNPKHSMTSYKGFTFSYVE